MNRMSAQLPLYTAPVNSASNVFNSTSVKRAYGLANLSFCAEVFQHFSQNNNYRTLVFLPSMGLSLLSGISASTTDAGFCDRCYRSVVLRPSVCLSDSCTMLK